MGGAARVAPSPVHTAKNLPAGDMHRVAAGCAVGAVAPVHVVLHHGAARNGDGVALARLAAPGGAIDAVSPIHVLHRAAAHLHRVARHVAPLGAPAIGGGGVAAGEREGVARLALAGAVRAAVAVEVQLAESDEDVLGGA